MIYSLADGVITVDLNNQLMVYNPVIKDILGIHSDKPLTMFDIVDGLAGKVDLRTKIEQAVAENKAITLPEVFLKDKALELTISPVKDNQGEIIARQRGFSRHYHGKNFGKNPAGIYGYDGARTARAADRRALVFGISVEKFGRGQPALTRPKLRIPWLP